MRTARIFVGDVRARLRDLPDGCVQTCVTSPPYWGLRDYGHDGQIGLEQTPEAYVAEMVAVFREVRRVLRDDGTLWLNLGDSYCSQGGSHDGREDNQPGVGAKRVWRDGAGRADGVVDERGQRNRNGNTVVGLKPKDLVGIPWRVAFALQADGWYLRSDIIWSKPNPMPESVTDRPTKAHEYLFLLSKAERYYYDKDAICEPYQDATLKRRAPHHTTRMEAATAWLIRSLPDESATEQITSAVPPIISGMAAVLLRRTATCSSVLGEPTTWQTCAGTPTNIALWLSRRLGEGCGRANRFTTSTATRRTTGPRTLKLSKAALRTAFGIASVKAVGSSPTNVISWSCALAGAEKCSLGLTPLEGRGRLFPATTCHTMSPAAGNQSSYQRFCDERDNQNRVDGPDLESG